MVKAKIDDVVADAWDSFAEHPIERRRWQKRIEKEAKEREEEDKKSK